MPIFVGQSSQSLIAKNGIYSPLQMTLVEKHGFSFWQQNQKPLMLLRDSKFMLKRRQTLSLEAYVLIEEESLHHKNLIPFVI
jgi:hypothetical protein